MRDLVERAGAVALGHDVELDRVDLRRAAGSSARQAARRLTAGHCRRNLADARDGIGTCLLAERFLAKHGIKPRIDMEIGSNETIKQAVIAGLGIAFISAHTIASEIQDGRLVILDVAGLPEIRHWFVVRLATKRLMPAAGALRDFLVAEGRQFLPDVGQPRRGHKANKAPKLGSRAVNERATRR
jgi:DNA-binding transcriptional LysR family regulator